MFDLLLANALAVTPAGVQHLNIGVKDGLIAALLAPDTTPESARVFPCEKQVLLPGAIDGHSHITFCEEMAQGSRSAARGGITTLVEMPQSPLLGHLLDEAAFQARLTQFQNNCLVDFALLGGVRPEDYGALKAQAEQGAAGFKIFTCDVGDYPHFNDYELWHMLGAMGPLGALAVVHAENQSLCAGLTEELRASGTDGKNCFMQCRPVLAELLAAAQLGEMALETGAHVHVCHVTSPKVVDLLHHYRHRGAYITVETCPQYLTLTDRDTLRCSAYAKCGPPLRTDKDADGLWRCLWEGTVDTIGSDHACYAPQQKETGSFWDAPGGFPGMDLLLPTLVSEGLHKRGLAWEQITALTSGNPARVFGLAHRKGRIQVGLDADFALVDPQEEWRFTARESAYRYPSTNYPYEGRLFKGNVTATFVRGQAVYSAKAFPSARPGRYIPSAHFKHQSDTATPCGEAP